MHNRLNSQDKYKKKQLIWSNLNGEITFKFFLDFNQNQIYQNNSRDLGEQYEPPSNAEPNDLNEEINKALSTFNEFNQLIRLNSALK